MTTVEYLVAIALMAFGYAWTNRADREASDDEPWSIEPGEIRMLPPEVELVPYRWPDTDSTGCRS